MIKNNKILILFSLFLFFLSTNTSAQNYNKELLILVDVNESRLYLLDKETKTTIKTYPVGLGKKTTPSPIGTWKITSKALKPGPYGGYWLGLNVPWDTFGIHGTNRPDSIGDMQSGGCIRMFNYNIKELFNIVPEGTTVIVYGGPNWFFTSYVREIKPGYRGTDVYEVEKMLYNLGYLSEKPNGIYDYPTEIAIKKFQRDNNITESSTIDSNTLTKLGLYKFE